ncbi:hypothetical protein [Mycoplasma sp. SG1]|uniref:hypothetical protein n=1 Tax=Mycoplasma sp. SG1 TaxID=2810348 RepID=UPI0020244003|nr:hypothetical protein [Mycoplasma sp. SG1]URM52931.1 hypothetical protein JRW51_01120 [Mycoplasma sp. SG1]
MKLFKKITLLFCASFATLSLFAGCGNENKNNDKEILALAETALFNHGLKEYATNASSNVFSTDIINQINTATGGPKQQFLTDVWKFHQDFTTTKDHESVLKNAIDSINSGLDDPSNFPNFLSQPVINKWNGSTSFNQLFFMPGIPIPENNFSYYFASEFKTVILEPVWLNYVNHPASKNSTSIIQKNFEKLIRDITSITIKSWYRTVWFSKFKTDFSTLFISIYFSDDLKEQVDTTSSKVVFKNDNHYFISVKFQTSSSRSHPFWSRPFSGITFDFNSSTYVIDNIAFQ